MPFTNDQFLDVLGGYNDMFWPVVVALWLVSAAVVVWWMRAGVRASRALALVLVFHWAWSGLAYHALWFTTINPAAWIFSALFVVEAVCLLALGVVGTRLRFVPGTTPRHVLACALVGYSFVYPALTLWAGHTWPRAPIFAVPCPTMLLTGGLLLATEPPLPVAAAVVPVVWAVVGGSAAFLLGVRPDLALFVAGAAVAWWTVMSRSAAARLAASAVRIGGSRS